MNLANDTCLWEPKLLLRVGNWAAGACVASSPDFDLEAFSHNPAHGSFVPLAFQPSAMSNLIGRADIEGSKGNVAMNAWLPQASIGHAFTMCRRSQTPHLKMSSAWIDPPKRVLGSSFLADSANPIPLAVVSLDSRQGHWIPLVCTGSELAVRRPGKDPERAVPNPSPGRHEAVHSHHVSSSSSPPTVDGFGTGTPEPSPQSQSFSRSYGSIFPTSLAYIVPSTRGYSPWRPDVVMSTTGRERHSVLRIFEGLQECTGHHATCGALPAAGPYLRLSRFQGGQAVKQKR
ncbi:hypothetical protein YC2023_066362 [Brassica napus]